MGQTSSLDKKKGKGTNRLEGDVESFENAIGNLQKSMSRGDGEAADWRETADIFRSNIEGKHSELGELKGRYTRANVLYLRLTKQIKHTPKDQTIAVAYKRGIGLQEGQHITHPEQALLDRMVKNTRDINQHLWRKDIGERDGGIDAELAKLRMLTRKLKADRTLAHATTKTDFPLGEGAKSGDILTDKGLRFYGFGFVEGEYTMHVENLLAFNVTSLHGNTDYNQASGGDYHAEDQIFTLPNARLRFERQEDNDFYYTFVDDKGSEDSSE